MSILRLILFAFLLLLALVVTALGYIHFADLNRYTGQMASAVRQATGRDFSFRELDIDVWPNIALTAKAVTLGNADWGSGPDMLRVGHVSSRIAPASLLFGRILLKEITLEDVSVLVERDAEGQSNWKLSRLTGAQQEPAGRAGSRGNRMPVALEAARIVNVSVNRRAPGVDDAEFRLDRLTLEPEEADRLTLVAVGKLLGLPLTLNGQFNDRRALRWADEGDFALTGALGGLRLEATRRRGARDSAGQPLVKVTVSTDDLAPILDSAGADLPLFGPMTINAELSTDELGRTSVIDARLGEFNMRTELRVHPEQVAVNGKLERLDMLGEMLGVGGLPAAPVAVEGTFAQAADAVEIEALEVSTGQAEISVKGTFSTNEGLSSLELQGNGTNLSDVLATLPALPFDAAARVALGPGEVAFAPLQLRVGSSDVAGSMRLTGGTPTAIRVDLESQHINLDELAGDQDQVEETADPEKAAPPPGDPAREQGVEYVFVDQPLPLDALRRNELDFNLAVGQLISSAIPLRQLKFVGALHGGELTADIGFVTPAGARGTSQIRAKTSGPEVELDAEVNAQEMHPNIVSGEGARPEEIPPLSLSMSISSSGASPRALAANSQGNVLITLGEGRVDNNLMRRVSGDIFAQLSSALNPFAKQDPYTTFECGVMAVTIENGLCTLERLLLQGEKVTIVAGGELDLKTEKLNVEFNTHPREGVGVSPDMFVTPFVALGGTLAKQAVRANPKGTLLTAATGGTYLVLKAAKDRAAGQLDRCAEITSTYTHPAMRDN